MSAAPHLTTDITPLTAARVTLADACAAGRVGERYVLASRAAAAAAAVLLTVRTGHRVADAGSAPNRRVLWRLLGDAAPEFGEWADYFSAADDLARAGELGHRGVDDLVRAAGDFLDRVAGSLGVRTLAAAETTLHLRPLR